MARQVPELAKVDDVEIILGVGGFGGEAFSRSNLFPVVSVGFADKETARTNTFALQEFSRRLGCLGEISFKDNKFGQVELLSSKAGVLLSCDNTSIEKTGKFMELLVENGCFLLVFGQNKGSAFKVHSTSIVRCDDGKITTTPTPAKIKILEPN